MTTVPHFINGQRVTAEGVSPVFNPATGEVIATVPVPTPTQVDEVVTLARQTALTWSTSTLSQRTNILF